MHPTSQKLDLVLKLFMARKICRIFLACNNLLVFHRKLTKYFFFENRPTSQLKPNNFFETKLQIIQYKNYSQYISNHFTNVLAKTYTIINLKLQRYQVRIKIFLLMLSSKTHLNTLRFLKQFPNGQRPVITLQDHKKIMKKSGIF